MYFSMKHPVEAHSGRKSHVCQGDPDYRGSSRHTSEAQGPRFTQTAGTPLPIEFTLELCQAQVQTIPRSAFSGVAVSKQFVSGMLDKESNVSRMGLLIW